MSFARRTARLPGAASGILFLLAGAAATADPVAWLGVTEIAAGGGERGPWQQNDSRYDYVDDPTVAIDPHGGIAVAWVDQGRKDVFFRPYTAAGEPAGAAVNVSRSPATFSWLPRLAIAPDALRHVHALWQEIIFSGGSHGGDILFARSEDGGRSFAAPINLSRSVGGDGKGRINREVWHNGSLDLLAAAGGRLYAAWTEYDGALWFATSADGGAHFAAPRRIAGDDRLPARAPALALAPDGRLYLAWTVGEDPAADIRVAASADGGAHFGPPTLVAPSPGYSDAPRLAVDAAGVLHLAYAESAGGPFHASQVRYTRSNDGGRSFGPPRTISMPLPQGFGSAGFPALALDAAGRVYVAWELFPRAGARARALALAVSPDGGRRFAPPVPVAGSGAPAGGASGSFQGLLMRKLAVHRDGMVALVNSALVDGEGSRVWLLRGRTGAP